jgi:hypothetical protein
MNSTAKTDQVTIDRYITYCASNLLRSGSTLQGPLKALFEKFFIAIAPQSSPTFSLEDLIVTLATVCKGNLDSQTERNLSFSLYQWQSDISSVVQCAGVCWQIWLAARRTKRIS